ncbi:MAG: hypothetical protein R3F30_02105 [Planctomycetota bacterium]
MSEEEAEERGHDEGTPNAEPSRPKVSLGAVWREVRALQIDEKLWVWSAVVFLGAGVLPWQVQPGTALGFNAWALGGLETLAMLVVLAGLLRLLAGLGGLRPRAPGTWLRWYRYGLPVVPVATLWDLLRISERGFGLWIALMAVVVHLRTSWVLLARNDLLPFEVER